ncbi:hypothetical protein MMC13_007021 [Lambiella insularis]|nr:hypothetical protein [Lambiella insularis]
MAEALGAVASGISIGALAIHIASSVQQILEFWSSVKSAPADVQILLEELELLAEILSTVDKNGADAKSSMRQVSAVKALRCCQNAASCIDAVVRDLTDGFAMPQGRRYWTAVKAVLKDKRLTKALQRLERAKTLLSLAQQCYTQSEINALKEVQRQNFQTIEKLLTIATNQRAAASAAEIKSSTSNSALTETAYMSKMRCMANGRVADATYWLPRTGCHLAN